MRLSAITTITALALSLAAGCATEAAPEGASGGAGGKADDSTASEAGTMTEVTEADQSEMRAADVECLHSKYFEPYGADIKVICLPRGGVAAPTSLFIAAVAAGEETGVYKVYELPGFVSDQPESVTFRTQGNKAIVTFKAKYPIASEDDLAYQTKTVTAILDFAGDSEDPQVRATFTKQ